MKKILEWKERLKKGHMLSLVITLIIILVIISIFINVSKVKYENKTENYYNLALYELVDYVENVETYLAKAMISTSNEHNAQTLTHIWREAGLAQSYLTRLPINNNELENVGKFLNQVSGYSYSLAQKNIYGDEITDEENDNLKKLYEYSKELKNNLVELSKEFASGKLKWKETQNNTYASILNSSEYTIEDNFFEIEQNFHEYAGLIYDGAYSDHITMETKEGIIGEEITEVEAKEKVLYYIEGTTIEDVNSVGVFENDDIISYNFLVIKDDQDINISISKIGGSLTYMNSNRDIGEENININDAINVGKSFLKNKAFGEMIETYYLIQEDIITINYAAIQDNIVMYPDLIKVKIALDNGEILGIESTGYLNNHKLRETNNINISEEVAKKNINQKLEINSSRLAVIPTEWKTEILCYEFKGKIDEKEFIVYVNVENGKEEDILIVTETENGFVAM